MAGIVKIKIKRLRDVPLPEYRTEGAVGLDLVAGCDLLLPKKSYGLIPTGIAIELPPGIEGQVRPRSGLAAKYGIGVLNSPGTIDSDYRGEIKVVLFNLGDEDFLVKKGDRIAQLVFSLVLKIKWKEVNSLSPTERGEGGFGHTGER